MYMQPANLQVACSAQTVDEPATLRLAAVGGWRLAAGWRLAVGWRFAVGATNVAKYNAKVSLEVHLEWDRYKVAPCCQ